jgi:hypothetical protein
MGVGLRTWIQNKAVCKAVKEIFFLCLKMYLLSIDVKSLSNETPYIHLLKELEFVISVTSLLNPTEVHVFLPGCGCFTCHII